MGYAGGEKESPTYRAMGDHTECFQVDYDPSTISYEDLLDAFWTTHDPTRPAWKTQYASLVLASDDDQLHAAEASAQRIEAVVGRPVATRIERLGTFWLAEDYHQKYYLRNDPVVFGDLTDAYPKSAALLDSTAAARANGYLAGGSCTQLDRELPELGLSPRAADRLRARCHK